MEGDAGGDSDRGRTLGRVLGAEQFVGQPAGGGAVTGQSERIGETRAERGRPGIRGGAIQPRGPAGLALAAGRQLGQRVGEPLVL